MTVPVIPSAQAFQINDRVLLRPIWDDRVGPRRAQATVLQASAHDEEQVGQRVQTALSMYAVVTKMPDENPQSVLLKAANIKTQTELNLKVPRVAIEFDPTTSTTTFYPLHRKGRGHISKRTDPFVVVHGISAKELGHALLRAFAMCDMSGRH